MGKGLFHVATGFCLNLSWPEIQHSVVLLHLLWGGFGLCTFLLRLDKATREEVVVELLDDAMRETSPNVMPFSPNPFFTRPMTSLT